MDRPSEKRKSAKSEKRKELWDHHKRSYSTKHSTSFPFSDYVMLKIFEQVGDEDIKNIKLVSKNDNLFISNHRFLFKTDIIKYIALHPKFVRIGKSEDNSTTFSWASIGICDTWNGNKPDARKPAIDFCQIEVLEIFIDRLDNPEAQADVVSKKVNYGYFLSQLADQLAGLNIEVEHVAINGSACRVSNKHISNLLLVIDAYSVSLNIITQFGLWFFCQSWIEKVVYLSIDAECWLPLDFYHIMPSISYLCVMKNRLATLNNFKHFARKIGNDELGVTFEGRIELNPMNRTKEMGELEKFRNEFNFEKRAGVPYNMSVTKSWVSIVK